MVNTFPQRVSERLSDVSRLRHEERAHRRAGAFLKGPIPLKWLARASALPGKSLAVGLAIWYCAGLRQRQDDLTLCRSTLDRFGVSRQAGYRGLRLLEQAGLVAAVRQRGCCPRVDILNGTIGKPGDPTRPHRAKAENGK